MRPRVRYSTATLLLAMALVAVCFGWAVDHFRLQRLVHQMTRYEEMLERESKRRQAELDYANEVNRELRFERAKLKGLPPPPR